MASAVGTLLPEDRLDGLLGRSARLRDMVVAGLIIGLIPGGPYAVYPVIVSVQDSGASDPAVLTMLVGYGLIGVGRVPFGLVFFSPAVVTLRLAVAVAATVVLFVVGNVLADRSVASWPRASGYRRRTPAPVNPRIGTASLPHSR